MWTRSRRMRARDTMRACGENGRICPIWPSTHLATKWAPSVQKAMLPNDPSHKRLKIFGLSKKKITPFGWVAGVAGVAGWLGGWVAGWLAGALAGWLLAVGWPGSWVAGWPGAWVAVWVGGWLAGGLTGLFAGWLALTCRLVEFDKLARR